MKGSGFRVQGSERTLGVGIIGLGFMGRTHLAAYQAASLARYPCRIAAVCDRDTSRFISPESGPIPGPNLRLDPETRRYFHEDELLADLDVGLVSICTPTDTHVELTIRALKAGKHVLVEKPVALQAAEVHRAIEAAREVRTLVMPVMCMRFWPGWYWLKAAIESSAYGAVRSAEFRRLGGIPDWSREFYLDEKRSGGALIDLHIHDADFVRWCFGDPKEVESRGNVNHVVTHYRYDHIPGPVSAEGGWIPTPGFAFRMEYRVEFETATAQYDSRREQPLRLERDGRYETVPLGSETGYDREIRHFLEAITSDQHNLLVTLDDAEAVTRLLEAERTSLETHEPVARI